MDIDAMLSDHKKGPLIPSASGWRKSKPRSWTWMLSKKVHKLLSNMKIFNLFELLCD